MWQNLVVCLAFLSTVVAASTTREIKANSAYVPRKNVKDFGAKGDGITDDTAAIVRAITEGRGDDPNAAYPTTYSSSSITPALVYFPSGTYKITDTIPLIYYTQLVGDADNMPTIKMANMSTDKRMIDALDGRWGGDLVNQNNFFHQVRNFVLDMTECDACTGVHWQVAQATQLSNMHFNMKKDSKCQGIWMENGSGGFISDLVFDGGMYGLWVGNQQFTSRNITIRDTSLAAVYLNWDWGWSFKSLNIENSPVGIDVGSGTGSLLVADSKFSNISVAAVRTSFSYATDVSANNLVLDNVDVVQSHSVVMNGQNIALSSDGTATHVASWAQGRVWQDSTSTIQTLNLVDKGVAPARPTVLTSVEAGSASPYVANSFFEKARPSFDSSAYTRVNAVKDLGIANDGVTDVTSALQSAVDKCAKEGSVLFLPYGTYLITDTITFPANTRVLGEAWSVIMVGGKTAFADPVVPRAALKVGKEGEKGVAQFVDLLITTQGGQPGAVLVEWNMADPEGAPGSAGMWEVHFRVGGAIGTNIDPFTCPRGDGASAPAAACAGAWALMRITKHATAYLENVWGWVADHDLDYDDQINVYNARGLLVESQGPVWMYGTAFEHSLLYQYNMFGAKNVFMSMIQTETPYFQPAPLTPFFEHASAASVLAKHESDPAFCTNDRRCDMALGLVVQGGSDNVLLYGAGLYSFFDLWDQSCLGQQEHMAPSCQLEMTKVTADSKAFMYNLNTYGSVYMETAADAHTMAAKNMNGFCSTAAVNLQHI